MKNRSGRGQLFNISNIVIVALYASVCVIPFIHIIAGSFATNEELLVKDFLLIPTRYSMDAYEFIFSTPTLPRGLTVSAYLATFGTLCNMIFTCTMAYGLSRKDLDGRSAILLMVLFTMLFNGGLIPNYLLVKELGLIDSLWALILPGLIGPFILIIVKNFFQQLPDGLEESAKIDGAHDLQILCRIVLPLSKPVIATFSLFYAVGHWNTFMNAVLYINDANKWPIQVILRQIVLLTTGGFSEAAGMDDDFVQPPAKAVKMAVIVVATVPILLVYPFLQKHFAKGVLLGSVKG